MSDLSRIHVCAACGKPTKKRKGVAGWQGWRVYCSVQCQRRDQTKAPAVEVQMPPPKTSYWVNCTREQLAVRIAERFGRRGGQR